MCEFNKLKQNRSVKMKFGKYAKHFKHFPLANRFVIQIQKDEKKEISNEIQLIRIHSHELEIYIYIYI